jgi:ribosome-associated toxin RatA of RatAB toxin-antitoxin module
MIENMVSINLSREVHTCLDRVWDIISDIDKEPYFWPSIKMINNISRNGNVVEREVITGFRNSKSCQTVVIYPRTSIEVSMIKGPMRGNRNILLNMFPMENNKTRINILWDIDLFNIPVSNRAIISKNLRKETIEALNRIAQVA